MSFLKVTLFIFALAKYCIWLRVNILVLVAFDNYVQPHSFEELLDGY